MLEMNKSLSPCASCTPKVANITGISRLPPGILHTSHTLSVRLAYVTRVQACWAAVIVSKDMYYNCDGMWQAPLTAKQSSSWPSWLASGAFTLAGWPFRLAG